MSRTLRHREVRDAIADRISQRELQAGDPLPSERALMELFGCARSVVRQALATLTRDGWVMPAYPRGYLVLGPRIPWISRLRPLADEPPQVTIADVRRAQASVEVADALQIVPAGRLIERASELRGKDSGEPWGLGLVSYPSGELSEDSAEILLDPAEITYDDIEQAFGRRITGYREIMRARSATTAERKALELPGGRPLIEIVRVAQTTMTPISHFRFVGRSDQFEGDYFLPS